MYSSHDSEQHYTIILTEEDHDVDFKCPGCEHSDYFEITTPIFHDMTGTEIPLNAKDHSLICMKCGIETRVYGEPNRLSNWNNLVIKTKKLYQYGFNVYKPDQDLLDAIEEVESIVREQQEGIE